MTYPNEIKNAIGRALKNDDALSEVTEWFTDEIDPAVQQAVAPFGQIYFINSANITAWNTNIVDHVTDDAGGRIGYIFESTFDATLQIDLWLAVDDDRYDADELIQQTRTSLREYDSAELDADLQDANGNPLDDIKQIRVRAPSWDLDTNTSPSARKRMLEVDVRFVDRLNTAEEYGDLPYVETVDYPHDGDFGGGETKNIEIEYKAPDG